MFEQLQPLSPDAILMLMDMHNQDSNPNKIDLGAGIYKDEKGRAPIFKAVKEAERRFVATQETKAYIGPPGEAGFNQAISELIFGKTHPVFRERRIRTIQTPGGSGALRVAAEMILRARSGARIWASDPTWANHVPLLSSAGIKLEQYPYYDADVHILRFDAMAAALETVAAGDLVLLHGCCHNPTGVDLTREQWQTVAEIAGRRGFIPFIDLAYQGFAQGLDEDAFGIRLLAEKLPELIVASSCSKNFGVYRERTGALSFVTADERVANTCLTQMASVVRCLYSMPPTHGASLVRIVLSDPQLRAEWERELTTMRNRINGMRALVAGKLQQTTGRDFSFIASQNGMFSFLGISPDQVLRLREEFSIYMVDSGRISIPGLMEENIDYFVRSVSAVL